MISRIARYAPVVLAVLLAGACGSSAAKSGGASPTTLPKLFLEKAGGNTSAADDARAPGALAVRPMSYVLDGTLPDLGSKGTVYRWTAHSVTLDDVNRFAHALGIDASATTTPDGFQASGNDSTLLVSTSGGTASVSYYPGTIDSGGGSSGSSGASTGSAGSGTASDGSSSVAPIPPDVHTTIPSPITTVPNKLTAPTPVDVPSAHDAEGVARSLLDSMGVLDGQQWDSEVTDGGGIAISCVVGEKCTGDPASVSSRDVAFHLSINGVRAEGVDWSVSVGDHSKIESVYGEWGSADVIGAYALRTTAAAFDALKAGDTGSGGPEPLAGEVPVQAQGEPATAPTSTVDNSSTVDQPTTYPTDTLPVPDPLVVHVTGVSLGVARWQTVAGDQIGVDLVPTYVFHTRDESGNTSDVSVLALDPGAITFAEPPGPVTSVPGSTSGGGVPEPKPLPEPTPLTGKPKPAGGGVTSQP
jgi:hypothetical protein